MMSGVVGMLLSNSDTRKSLEGLGALKGAPCTIESIKDVTVNERTGTQITFKWTGENDTEERRSFVVLNGLDGESENKLQDITEKEINDICKI